MTPEISNALILFAVGIALGGFCFYINTHTKRWLPLDVLTIAGIFSGIIAALLAGWKILQVVL